MSILPDSNLFETFIPPTLLPGLIADLQGMVNMFPLKELERLPDFSPQTYLHRANPGDANTVVVEGVTYKWDNSYNNWLWVKIAYGTNQNAKLIQQDRLAILTELRAVQNLQQGYQHLLNEEYRLAHYALVKFYHHPRDINLLMDANRLQAALSNVSLVYYLTSYADNPWGGVFQPWPAHTENLGHIRKFKLDLWPTEVLPSWSGWLIEKIMQAYAPNSYSHFVDFNLFMLRAEVYRGLGDLNTAEAIYADLMQGKPGKFENPDKDFFNLKVLSPVDDELVRIRRGLNLLQMGDQAYSQAHILASDSQAANLADARNCYQAAENLFIGFSNIVDWHIQNIDERNLETVKLEQSTLAQLKNPDAVPGGGSWGLSQPAGGGIFGQTPNPIILEIIYYAKLQILKLDASLNFLGLRDNFIPAQHYQLLWSRAREYAGLAIETELKMIQFKKEAESDEFLTARFTQEAQLAGYPVQACHLRYQEAEDRFLQDQVKLAGLQAKIDNLSQPGVAGTIFAALAMAAAMCAAPFTAGSSLAAVGAMGTAFASFIGGQMSSSMSAGDQLTSLVYEKQAILIDRMIAARQRLITALETEVARLRSEYLSEGVTYLQNKEMSHDLYFAIASALKRITSTYLQIAIQMGYLAERALAFEIDRTDLHLIKFNYGHSELKNLMGGDFLLQDLMMMDYLRTISLKKRNRVKHVLSLRNKYPLEYQQLIQTGQADFPVSLYEFDKAYPGSYNQRLKDVEVLISGVQNGQHLHGRLTHHGTFLVRKAAATLLAADDRLLPDAKDLQDAFAALTIGDLGVVDIGGVAVYQLPPTHLILSSYAIRNDGIIFPADESVRGLFEDYGPNGLWRLELPLETNDLAFQHLQDVQLIFYFDADFDPQLERKLRGAYDPDLQAYVPGMLWKYERKFTQRRLLDRITAISLATRYPQAFANFAQGSLDFELRLDDFPLNQTDLKVKKIIVQALDNQGKGVAGLQIQVIRKPIAAHPFKITLTTLGDGFTERINRPDMDTTYFQNPQPLIDHWRIETQDLGSANKVADLLAFFVYTYKDRR